MDEPVIGALAAIPAIRQPTTTPPRALPGQPPVSPSGTGSDTKVDPEREREIARLRARDREVRTHEQAHMAAGGSYVSGPYYEYTTGPDGKRYVTGGSVSIDASPVAGRPDQTITKMDVVIRAALAPADPSGQDLQVAASARSTKLQAQAEAAARRTADMKGTSGDPGRSDDGRRGSLLDIRA